MLAAHCCKMFSVFIKGLQAQPHHTLLFVCCAFVFLVSFLVLLVSLGALKHLSSHGQRVLFFWVTSSRGLDTLVRLVLVVGGRVARVLLF